MFFRSSLSFLLVFSFSMSSFSGGRVVLLAVTRVKHRATACLQAVLIFSFQFPRIDSGKHRATACSQAVPTGMSTTESDQPDRKIRAVAGAVRPALHCLQASSGTLRGTGWARYLSLKQVMERTYPLLRYVVAHQHVLFSQKQLAVDDDRVRPALAFLVVRHEVPLQLIAVRRGGD